MRVVAFWAGEFGPEAASRERALESDHCKESERFLFVDGSSYCLCPERVLLPQFVAWNSSGGGERAVVLGNSLSSAVYVLGIAFEVFPSSLHSTASAHI